MGRVFISYRHVKPDEGLAATLRARLDTNGHAAFMDVAIGIGQDWVLAIENELRRADVFVVLLSKDSILSDMVRKEVSYAYALRRRSAKPRILPVRVDFEDTLPYDLGAYLDRLQYVVWKPPVPFELVADKLVDAINAPQTTGETGPQDIYYEGHEELYGSTEAKGAPLPAADPRLVATLESGTLRVDSPFYIRRESDDVAEACLRQGTGTTIIVKAPRQMGKSSLLARMHAQARKDGRGSWYRDFQYLDSEHLKDLDSLFRCLAREMAHVFRTPTKPQDLWDDDEGPSGNLTSYLEDAVLSDNDVPVQIVFDEAERVFDFPYRDQFFATIRAWHNRRAISDRFAKLTIIIGHATTPALWIQDLNQSPFNVGQSIKLQGFDGAQIAELGLRHRCALSHAEVDKLLVLLGGHPYLTRVALYTLTTRHWRIDHLLGVAGDETGPFADHLRGLAWVLKRTPELQGCLRQIVHGKTCEDETHFQKLWAAGLIRGETRREAEIRCGLYETYFRNHL